MARGGHHGSNSRDLTNPKDALGDLKPPIHFVPPCLEVYAATAFADGGRKYGPFNWRERAVRYSVYYAAGSRHAKQAFDGEDRDPKSKVLHLAHAIACFAIILDAMLTGNLIDDRPPKGRTGELIREYELMMGELQRATRGKRRAR